MQFRVAITDSADADLQHYRVFEQRAVLEAIKIYLISDANVETRRRKRLRENPIAPWELRVGKHRVFYELAEPAIVKVVAVGHKEHNDLFIRGRKVEL